MTANAFDEDKKAAWNLGKFLFRKNGSTQYVGLYLTGWKTCAILLLIKPVGSGFLKRDLFSPHSIDCCVAFFDVQEA